MEKFENRLNHFTTLKSKYQATKYEDSSLKSLLYLILRKVDLGIELTELEFNWLKEHELFETVESIYKEQQYKVEELKQLENEFSALKVQYKVPKFWQGYKVKDNISVPLYSILYQLHSESPLTNSEIEWLEQNRLVQTIAIAREMEFKLHFVALKTKYQATKYQGSSPNSPLYKIIKQLETKERVSYPQFEWLRERELFETIEICEQQEAEKKAEFAQLKAKYQAIKYPDVSVSSPLYPILQKLDADKKLIVSEISWLEQQELTETIVIANELEQKREFIALKAKYKATRYEDSSPSSHLYKVLKRLDLENYLSEQDINFLKKRKLTDTIAIAQEKYASTLQSKIESGNQLSESEINWLKNNGRENIITFAQEKHFAVLKSKYDVSDYRDKSPTSPLYEILQKLEKRERLEARDVAWLEENKTEGCQPTYNYYEWREERSYKEHKLFSGKILIAYHTIEATFYEQEFKRAENKWNLPNASSHWRKAYQPQRALQVTENIDFGTIKENKLKSALLTTRGGAFRDIKKLDKAEDCARKAIEYQPGSHHPYTLMGAICYERHQYSDGDDWFNEAIKRGANPRDVDSEIKRVVRNAKDENKRREVVEYLLKKDSQRYAWAKSYLKKHKNQG